MRHSLNAEWRMTDSYTEEKSLRELEAPFTIVHFRITFATVAPILYTTPVFSRWKTETFENAADPILV